MVVQAALTPNDLLHLPPPENGKAYELSHGELIVIPMTSTTHDVIRQRIVELLVVYTHAHGNGKIFPESTFTIGDGARIPDVAFIANAKYDALVMNDKVTPFAPDLAIEVISPSETVAYAERKVDDYLAAGVAEVWQVNPDSRRVRIRTATAIRDVQGNALLETPLLPGFSVPVSEIFAAK